MDAGGGGRLVWDDMSDALVFSIVYFRLLSFFEQNELRRKRGDVAQKQTYLRRRICVPYHIPQNVPICFLISVVYPSKLFYILYRSLITIIVMYLMTSTAMHGGYPDPDKRLIFLHDHDMAARPTTISTIIHPKPADSTTIPKESVVEIPARCTTMHRSLLPLSAPTKTQQLSGLAASALALTTLSSSSISADDLIESTSMLPPSINTCLPPSPQSSSSALSPPPAWTTCNVPRAIEPRTYEPVDKSWFDKGLDNTQRVQLKCDQRGKGSGRGSQKFAPKWIGKWWYRTTDQIHAMDHRDQCAISNISKIIETSAGRELKGSDKCTKCKEKGFECHVYTIQARADIKFSTPVCARCRLRTGSGACSFSVRMSKKAAIRRKELVSLAVEEWSESSTP
jgi:hypothetical protein